MVHELDGEALVYDPRTADTHRLNSTAFQVFRLLDGTRSTTDVARVLTTLYDVAYRDALEHTRRVLTEMERLALLDGAPSKQMA